MAAKHPEMYAQDANIDRRKSRRVVPMQVLSLGMPRTGTASMKAALQILGYNDCYHFFDLFSNIQDCDMWMDAHAAKFDGKGKFGRAEWDKLLGHCMAITDAPGCSFGPELIEAYPEAKVILVERDIEAWYKSFSIIIDVIFNPAFSVGRLVAWLDPFWAGRVQGLQRRWMADELNATTLETAHAAARDRYRAHAAEIRKMTPKDRLLEYELGSGWEPLCKFLGKEIPNVPFPRINEAAALRERMGVMKQRCIRRAVRNVAGGLTVCLGVVFGVHYLL